MHKPCRNQEDVVGFAMASGSIEVLDPETLFELEMVMETTSEAEFGLLLNLNLYDHFDF